jgi:hypothetical protein
MGTQERQSASLNEEPSSDTTVPDPSEAVLPVRSGCERDIKEGREIDLEALLTDECSPDFSLLYRLFTMC